MSSRKSKNLWYISVIFFFKQESCKWKTLCQKLSKMSGLRPLEIVHVRFLQRCQSYAPCILSMIELFDNASSFRNLRYGDVALE